MWSDGGGIADNLSREFRAMSSERDRRWGIERGSYGGRDTAQSAYVGAGRRTLSPDLRYSSQERNDRNTYERYQPIRRYSHDEEPYTTVGEGWRTGSGGAPSYSRRAASSRSARKSQGPQASTSRSRRAWEDCRGRSSGRDFDDDGSDSFSYSYSYSYSTSGSDSEEDSSSSGYDDDCGGTRRRSRHGARPSSPPRVAARGGTMKAKAPHPVRYTPTGPVGAVRTAPVESNVHWVGDGGGGAGNGSVPLPAEAGRVAADSQLQLQPPPGVPRQMPSMQPSALLRRVVEAVAYYRGVQVPPAIPSEVTLAFDEYVSRGSTMLKFLAHGPPHSRFFIIRFLDVIPGGRRHGKEGPLREMTMPHAVLSWYRNTSSRHMIRFLPLHDLMSVKADGSDHPYVQRRMVQPGMLRGPRTGLSTSYVYADYILQFCFRSRLSPGEERLALKTANRTQHLAWLVVGSFVCQIGGGGVGQFR